MWSVMIIMSPIWKSGFMPPAAFENKQCVDTQGFHNSDRERHLLHAISFIEMEASLHSHYTFVAEISENQFPLCPSTVETGKLGMS